MRVSTVASIALALLAIDLIGAKAPVYKGLFIPCQSNLSLARGGAGASEAVVPGPGLGEAVNGPAGSAADGPITSSPCIEAHLDAHIRWRTVQADGSLTAPALQRPSFFDTGSPKAAPFVPVFIVTSHAAKYIARATDLVASLRAAGVLRSAIVAVQYDRDQELRPSNLTDGLHACLRASWSKQEDKTHFEANVTSHDYAMYNGITHIAAGAEIVRVCPQARARLARLT